MKNRILLYLLEMVFTCMIFVNGALLTAQNSIQPERYEGISDNNKIPVFIEGFENDDNKWQISMHTLYADVDSGFFKIVSINDNIAILKKTDIAANDNFEIETEFFWIPGGFENYFGLHWGADPIYNHEPYFSEINYYLSLLVNLKGQYLIEETEGWKSHQIFADTIMLIPTRGLIKLTIRKIDKKAYFFINESPVFQYEPKCFFGQYFGFKNKDYISIRVDNFKIWKIAKE